MKTKTITLFLALLASASTLLAQTPTSITVAEANELIKTMDDKEVTSEYYEVIGYAVAYCGSLDQNYHNQDFVIADKDITHFSVESDAVAFIYRGTPDKEVKQGYKVRVIAKIQNYFGTAEFIKGTVTVIDDTEIPIPNKCGTDVTWDISNDTLLTISGTGTMYDYSMYYLQPWYNNQNIKSIVITNGVTTIGKNAFEYCRGLKSVTIPNSVISLGDNAFGYCNNLTSITIPNSVTNIGSFVFSRCDSLIVPLFNNHVFAYLPRTYSGEYVIPDGIRSIAGGAFADCTNLISVEFPSTVDSIGNNAFSNCTNLTDILVPCGELERFKQMLDDSRIKYRTSPYSITCTATNGNVSIPEVLTTCRNVITATPNRGYQFVRWTDGNTENPRTIELTQDTTLEAIFDYLLEGKCGKDSALIWKLDTTTMALEITGKGALSENYTYGTFIESLTVGNEVTIIGYEAFEKFKDLKNIIIGTSVKVLEEQAFKGCTAIETITCYSQRPPTVNNRALEGLDYSTIIYVPADYLNTYVMHDTWGLYDVRPLGAKSTETTEVTVTPAENTVDVIWPAVSGAATYELVIKDKDGNVICTLIFNANGQLTQIAFGAPARDHSTQQTQGTGFFFTVTGLESGTGYDLTITSKDGSGSTLDSQTISFTTTGEPQAVENVPTNINGARKVFFNGQILILRGDKVYTTTGQEVK